MPDTERLKGGARNLAPRARLLGRVALWALVALLLVRGLGATMEPSEVEPAATTDAQSRVLDDRSTAFAIRFARAYLSDPSKGNVTGYFPVSAPPRIGAASSGGQEVVQVEVTGTRQLEEEQAIVTVAAELPGGRVQHLAVPIVTARTGEVAAAGLPYVVAAPALPDQGVERPEPLTGAEVPAIEGLVGKFLTAYISAADPSELSYFLAPGTSVAPLGGSFALTGPPHISLLGEGEQQTTVLATVRMKDSVSGSVYPAGYRLGLVKHERWYVDEIEGAIR